MATPLWERVVAEAVQPVPVGAQGAAVARAAGAVQLGRLAPQARWGRPWVRPRRQAARAWRAQGAGAWVVASTPVAALWAAAVGFWVVRGV